MCLKKLPKKIYHGSQHLSNYFLLIILRALCMNEDSEELG